MDDNAPSDRIIDVYIEVSQKQNWRHAFLRVDLGGWKVPKRRLIRNVASGGFMHVLAIIHMTHIGMQIRIVAGCGWVKETRRCQRISIL